MDWAEAIKIDTSEPDCRNVEQLVKSKETVPFKRVKTFVTFMLARQLALWGLECLSRKIRNPNEDEFPVAQEEILLENIRDRIQDLKPDLIKWDVAALKRFGLILQEYVPGADAAFNQDLMSGFQTTYSSIYNKMKASLKERDVKDVEDDAVVDQYKPNPDRPSPIEEYLKLQLDVHSLFKIKSQIRQFLQESEEGKLLGNPAEYDLALQRLFHVAGEYVKQTRDTPNLSVESRGSLMKKGVPVKALAEYRDKLAHQMYPMIETTDGTRKGLEDTWREVERLLENEITDLEGKFFENVINEKMKDGKRLEEMLAECEIKSVACLLGKAQLEMKEDPKAIEELGQLAARMKSPYFPQQMATGNVKDQVEIIPDTKKAIVDFMIASKEKLYDVIHGALKGKIDEEKYSLNEKVREKVKTLLEQHENDMEIMKVRDILSSGGTAEEESLEAFFRKLPDISRLNENKEYFKVKEELKKYFDPDEIANYNGDWVLPNDAKMSEARELLKGAGEQGEEVMWLLNVLRNSPSGAVINFTPEDYKTAVDKLEHVESKEKLYSVSVEWKKNECAKLLNYYFTDLMGLYNEMLGVSGFRRKKNTVPEMESERNALELHNGILPITVDLFEGRVKMAISDIIRLENPIAVEAQFLNVVELLKRSKALSEQLHGKSAKRGDNSGELKIDTEGDITKFRNYLSHGDALVTEYTEEQMSKKLVELKEKIKGRLEEVATGNEKIDFDKVGDIIRDVYPGVLAIKDILCPNSGDPNKRRKGREIESCLTWEDVEEVVDNKEGPMDPDNIKIDSEKMMSVLDKEIRINEEKFKNYIALTTESEVKGPYKSEVVRVVHHQETYGRHLEKVEKFSGAVMHGIMAKNILGEILRGDYKDVEVDVGFLGGSFLLGEVSKIAARKGAVYALEGSSLLGGSLKLASPLLARGVSVFVAYDLYNQIKALESGDKDAIVNVVSDGIQLATDAAELGVQIAEGLSLVEGVSVVTGPIGMAIGATVFVGTEIYKAVKAVENIEKTIHLNGLEKFNEGVRAFIGMNPSNYISNIIEVKQGNNAAVESAKNILKSNPNIRRYVFPSYVESHYAGDCYGPMSALNSTVRLALKVNDIEWSRTSPENVPGVDIFCKPHGKGERAPEVWGYYCENAIGVEYINDRTDSYTLINMGKGNAFVEGFQDSGNIFIVDRHHKVLIGGSEDDSFIFHWDPTPIVVNKQESCTVSVLGSAALLGGPVTMVGDAIEGRVLGKLKPKTKIVTLSSKMVGVINGAGGIDTIDVKGLFADSSPNVGEVIADFPHKSLTYTDQVAFTVTNVEKFLGTSRRPDRVIAACNTAFIDGRGGYDERAQDVIRIPNLNCSYNTTVIIDPHTTVTNDAVTGNFRYFIRGNPGTSSEIKFEQATSKSNNTVTIQYGLHDLAAIEKSDEAVKFSFVKDFYSQIDTIKHDNSFNLTITNRIEGHTYLLMDDTILSGIVSTRIVVGKRNLYAMQNTLRAIGSSPVEEYTALAAKLKMYLVVHSKNEVLTITGPLNDVLTNDPTSDTSHFVSGAGENIYSFISGQDKLTMKKLFINDVVIHYFSKDESTDRLDLRKIMTQVRKDLGMEINLIVRRVQNNLVLNLFTSDDRKDYVLLKITLKDVVGYLWYRKIQIIMDTVFSIEEYGGEFQLVPEPLIFNDPNDTLFVVNPRDVAIGMKIKISRELKKYVFTRREDALIITNSLNHDSHRYPLVTVVLNGLYADRGDSQRSGEILDEKEGSKMISLVLEFDDTTIDLGKEMHDIHTAEDYLSVRKAVESDSYRHLLEAVRNNRDLFERIGDGVVDAVRSYKDFISKNEWVNPLAYAVIEGNDAAAVGLTRFGGANITGKDVYGHSPLYYAVKHQREGIISSFQRNLFEGKNTEAVKEIMTDITSELPVLKYVTEVRESKAGWPEFDTELKYTGATLLHFAAIGGNLEAVEYLIEKGGRDGSISAVDDNGQIALYYAVKYNHSSVVDYFMQTIRGKGLGPLSFSITDGNMVIVQYLVEKKRADIYEKDKLGKTPLFYAFRKLADDARDYLINVIKKEGEGQVLIYPVITGDMGVLRSLMRYSSTMNISINERNILGKTPLHYAAMYGNLAMVEFLVDRNADVKASDQSGRSPLDYAVQNQCAEVVEYLCEKLGLNPLLTAAGAGRARLVKELAKDENAVHTTRDEHGNTVLHLAATSSSGGGSEVVGNLIKMGLPVDVKNSNLQTPLHLAASVGNVDVAKMLVSVRADVNARDAASRTPLDHALENQHAPVVVYLSEVKGEDSLLLATEAGSTPTVRYLIENGANIHERDEKQQTLLHLAVISEKLELVEYLVNAGLDPNVKNERGQTPLHYAAMSNLPQIGEFLIRNGADTNIRDDWGWTPLFWVIDKGNSMRLLKLLVDNGADLRGRDVLGRTPLDLAGPKSEFTWYLGILINRRTRKRPQRKRRQVNADQKYRKSHHLGTVTDNVSLGANAHALPQGDAAPSTPTNPGFLNWARSLLQYKTQNSSADSPSQFSPQIDANGTIMLLDLLIRKNTGRKHVGTPDGADNPLDIQARALNVVRIFEETLNNAALEFGIDVRNLNFDPVALQSTVIRQLRLGKSSEIPKSLYNFAKNACSESSQCGEFLEYLRVHLEQGSDERGRRKVTK